MTTSRHSPLSVKRIRSALVLLCLLAFSVVSILHAAHHAVASSHDVSVTAAALPGDANDPADVAADLAEMCLVCALASAPIELFVFAAPARTAMDVVTVLYSGSPIGSSTEAPPPRA